MKKEKNKKMVQDRVKLVIVNRAENIDEIFNNHLDLIKGLFWIINFFIYFFNI